MQRIFLADFVKERNNYAARQKMLRTCRRLWFATCTYLDPKICYHGVHYPQLLQLLAIVGKRSKSSIRNPSE
jgi:hypothetical protein